VFEDFLSVALTAAVERHGGRVSGIDDVEQRRGHVVGWWEADMLDDLLARGA
jgi:hypothetical protein